MADAKRSQLFTKLAKAISVAARDGADIGMNPKLRLAVDRARSMSMPKDNIERAIQKGAGGTEGAALSEVRYEAYGPGGVAFLIDALTDNRNRTSSSVRHILEKHGGRLAEVGSVAWMFETKGVLQFPSPANRDEAELMLIDAGAEDIIEGGDELEVRCAPEAFEALKAKLAEASLEPSYTAIEPMAKTSTQADAGSAAQLTALREALDEDEDVTDFYDNEA